MEKLRVVATSTTFDFYRKDTTTLLLPEAWYETQV